MFHRITLHQHLTQAFVTEAAKLAIFSVVPLSLAEDNEESYQEKGAVRYHDCGRHRLTARETMTISCLQVAQ